MAPPQHGKTSLVEDFISWLAGRDPQKKVMFTSYSEDLGLRVNLMMQRRIDAAAYQEVFPLTRLPASGDRRWTRNTNFLEYPGHGGSFRNTTVLGQVTGQALDLGVIDDPIKGRREAQSETVRDSTWNWLTDDFFTRFSDRAGLLLVMTRWHVDDPAGRFLDTFPDTVILKYPAIAENDEQYRVRGAALFPEFKSVEFLEERRKLLTNTSWLSLYQQSPIVQGGGMFPIEKFSVVEAMPAAVKKTFRYWDCAATADGGAYTAGVRMHALVDGTFLVSDVRRGQWSALNRRDVIKQTAKLDGQKVKVVLEQEPGSSGKEVAEQHIRMLAGFSVSADRVTGPKEIRAEPYAAQVQAGNVALLSGPWIKDFLSEHEEFPNGTYKDQVDAAGGAFAKLASGPRYNSDLSSWVGDPGQLIGV